MSASCSPFGRVWTWMSSRARAVFAMRAGAGASSGSRMVRLSRSSVRRGGGAADVVRGDGLDGGEVAAGEIEIARFVPVRREVGGAAGGGGQAAELAGGDLAFGLGEIVVQRAGSDGGDFQQDRLDQRVAFGRLGIGGDCRRCPSRPGPVHEKAEISRASSRSSRKRAVEAGGAAAAEDGGEHVEGGRVRVIERGGFPSERNPAGRAWRRFRGRGAGRAAVDRWRPAARGRRREGIRR